MKTRIVHTNIWEDPWFVSLSEDGQKLFLYLITNMRANMCGIYKLADRTMEFDAKLTAERLEKAKAILSKPWGEDNEIKIFFHDGWVYVKNMQRLGGYKGTLCENGIKREMADIPEKIKKCFLEGKCDTPSRGMQGVYEGSKEVMLVEENLWTNLTPAQQMRAFLENELKVFEGQAAPVQEIVKQWLMAKWKVAEDIALFEMQKFMLYWTEPTASGKKVRWQTEKTFEVKRRFTTWMNNKNYTAAPAGTNNKYQVQGL